MKTLAIIFAILVILSLLSVVWAVLIVGARADDMAEPHGDVVKVPRS